MKVKLNEYEAWEINLKQVYEPQEFLQVVERFNDTAKIIRKGFMGGDSMPSNDIESNISPYKNTDNISTDVKRKYTKSTGTFWGSDRNVVIKAIKLHYFGTQEEKNLFANNHNTQWVKIPSNLYRLKTKFNIRPQEVGLKRYHTNQGHLSKEELERIKL